MIREDEFLALAHEDIQNDADIWRYRQFYRGLSKKMKRGMDRQFVKLKQNMTFSEWFEKVGRSVQAGHAKMQLHKEAEVKRSNISFLLADKVNQKNTLTYLKSPYING